MPGAIALPYPNPNTFLLLCVPILIHKVKHWCKRDRKHLDFILNSSSEVFNRHIPLASMNLRNLQLLLEAVALTICLIWIAGQPAEAKTITSKVAINTLNRSLNDGMALMEESF
jgi:hypothetical protein